MYLQIHLPPGFNPSFHRGNGEVWGEGEGLHLEASLSCASVGDGEQSCDYLVLCHEATKVHNAGGYFEMGGGREPEGKVKGEVESGMSRGGEWDEERWRVRRGEVESGTRRGGEWDEEKWRVGRGKVESGAGRGGEWDEERWRVKVESGTWRTM